jgi:hypothetical protein
MYDTDVAVNSKTTISLFIVPVVKTYINNLTKPTLESTPLVLSGISGLQVSTINKPTTERPL